MINTKSQIIKTYESFDINKINLESPRETKTGSKYFDFIYPDNEEWYIQLPRCIVIFKPEFSISLNVETQEFEEFLDTLDKFVLNSVSKFFEEDIKDVYIPILKIYDDSETYIRFNISKNTEFFDTSEKNLEQHLAVDNMKTGDEVKCIIKLKHVQFKKQRSTGEFMLSVQTTLQQVKTVYKHF